MDLDFAQFLPKDFDPSSRVWIYQSSRVFFMSEALQIEEILETFVSNWKSHGTPVKGFANLLYGQFIVIIADESQTNVGGCSTDSSVHVIKNIEQTYKVNLLDRQNLAFVVKDKIQTIPFNQFNYALENKFITEDTFYFNNTVLQLDAMLEKWIVPIKKSWLHARIKIVNN